MRRRLIGLLETARALTYVARTTYLFRVRGNLAVAAATEAGMRAPRSSAAELQASGVDAWLLLRAVHRARLIWPAPVLCLQTALAFQSMLHAHGLSGRLRVGVRKNADALQAHAWVELANFVFDPDRLAQDFLPVEQSAQPHPPAS